MSFGNTTENDLMLLIFNKTLPAWAGALSSSGNTHLYVSLHTDDVGEAGSQTTNEASYTGYARVAVIRTSAGFTVSGNQVSNTALVQFDPCTGGSATVSHFAIGTLDTGAGQVIAKGALSASRSISDGIQPQYAAGVLVATLD